ncbi:MAG: ATP-binding cassette domain-containing protein [Acidobacteriia bacterium]|nr:ATP-binding cassette domain-containing protein [Terriglobia bacterium]
MLVRFEHVKISFGAAEVLEEASFQIDPGERIGLIGRNGSGKTTILRLIAGQIAPDAGTIVRSAQLQISYLEQLVHGESNATVFKAAEGVFSGLLSQEREIELLTHRLSDPAFDGMREPDSVRLSDLLHQFELRGGYSFRARTEAVLMGLGFGRSDFSRPCEEISGGQMNRLNLARLLLGEPNLLLLDEPTNHLDLEAVAWLEDFLQSYPSAFLVVSHDRYFLNRVVRRIFELENGRIQTYSGDYSSYHRQRQLRIEQATKAYGQQREWIERTEDYVRRNIAGQKTKQAQSRRKMLAKVERLEKPSDSEESARFDFHVTLPSAHRVLEIEDGAIGYGETAIVKGIELKLFRGERYGVIGRNGSGKSTFLKTICGRLKRLSGAWIPGERVHLGYYDQTLENLNASNTVLEELRLLAPLATDGELRSFAARILFKGDDVFQGIESLSGGEKSRLSLAKLICQHPNFLLLDEPTNHLDIASREALEEALTEYDGTLLVATHDRYLLEQLVSRLLVFEDGKMELFDARYSEYVKGSSAAPSLLPEDTKMKGSKDEGKRGVRLSLADVPKTETETARGVRKPGTNRERQRVQDLARLEDEITKLELELRDLEERLSDSTNYSDPSQIKSLSETYQSLTEQLRRLYDEWAALEREEA